MSVRNLAKSHEDASALRVQELIRENAILRREIRVAREAAEITASLVVKQFEETERVLQTISGCQCPAKSGPRFGYPDRHYCYRYSGYYFGFQYRCGKSSAIQGGRSHREGHPGDIPPAIRAEDPCESHQGGYDARGERL